jgi:hypothetical protein
MASANGSRIQGIDIHRHRALELLRLADKTQDPETAAELRELAAEQWDLADSGGTAQQQQQAPPNKG